MNWRPGRETGGRGRRMTNNCRLLPAVLTQRGPCVQGRILEGQSLGVLVLSPSQRREGRHREGKVLAGELTGWVAGLGSDLTCPVSQVSALSTEDAAGPRPSAREVLGEKQRGEQFDPGKQSPGNPIPSEPWAMSTDLSFAQPLLSPPWSPRGPCLPQHQPKQGLCDREGDSHQATGRVCHAWWEHPASSRTRTGPRLPSVTLRAPEPGGQATRGRGAAWVGGSPPGSRPPRLSGF